MDSGISLRAFRRDDLEFLDRLCMDPEALGWYEWNGWRDGVVYALLRADDSAAASGQD